MVAQILGMSITRSIVLSIMKATNKKFGEDEKYDLPLYRKLQKM